jgi:Tol biopolymer transport system component
VKEDVELRKILRATAEQASLPSVMPQPMRRRVALRRARTIGVTFLITVAIVVGGLQGMRAVTLDEAAPEPAAGERGAEKRKVRDVIVPDPNVRDVTPAVPAPEVPYVIDLTTREMTPLPDAIIRSLATGRFDAARFAASPDGSSLAFVGEGDDGSPQIFIAAIDGTGLRQVTHDPTGATSPAWSPDGTKIAYEGYGSGNVRNLFVVDVATGESRQITHDSPPCRRCPLGPQFTPDGTSIIYSGGTGTPDVVRTVPVAGGKSTILLGRGRGGMDDAANGALSPDGSLVTMMGSPIGGGGAIRVVANVDGSELRHVPGRGSTPAGTWSPDGTRIVCRAYDFAREGILADPARDSILVVEVATRDASLVAEGSGAIWLDDHTLLVDV